MGRPKKTETSEIINIANEIDDVKDENVNEASFDDVKEDVALVDEETEEISEADKCEAEVSSSLDSLSKIANTIADAVAKKNAAPKAEPAKKPWKLGFWGYLGLAVIVKGAVEITRAITDAKRPRR